MRNYSTKITIILWVFVAVMFVLKACDIATCSWWWVFAPVLIPLALLLIMGIVLFIVWQFMKRKYADKLKGLGEK